MSDSHIVDPEIKKYATPRQAEIIDAVNLHGSGIKAAEALGMDRRGVDRVIKRVLYVALTSGYKPKQGVPGKPAKRDSRVAQRYLLTAAQDDTPVHEGFWQNLLAYATHLNAEIVVGGFTYQKGLFEDHATRTAAFVSEVQPYLQHGNVDIAGGELVFAARMNTLPTAVRPLSGLETYTRGKWGVFPHAKIQLVSTPAVPGKHPSIQMTTGACTVPNYVEKKAGIKAEFHHQIGAVIVEVTPAGEIFCRHVTATDDGAFQDLDLQVNEGEVTEGHRVEAITWGDIHREQIDPVVADVCWGIDVATGKASRPDSILDVLRPRHQFFHDLLDFQYRNHHRIKDHHFKFRMFASGTECVESAINDCATFLRDTAREWCRSVVVSSNHHDAYVRWLKEVDGRTDPVNELFWLRSNLAVCEAIRRGDPDFNVFRWALEETGIKAIREVTFPPRNGSYLICQDVGGIENAVHGDQGPNGARGTPGNLTRVATRLNTAHTHSASVLDGVWTAGLCGLIDQGYNEGPSSWSHSQTVTYANGRRTIITIINGRWRA